MATQTAAYLKKKKGLERAASKGLVILRRLRSSARMADKLSKRRSLDAKIRKMTAYYLGIYKAIRALYRLDANQTPQRAQADLQVLCREVISSLTNASLSTSRRMLEFELDFASEKAKRLFYDIERVR